MMKQSRKKNRVHNRAITVSARAARALRRSSQHQSHGTDGSDLAINNNNDNIEEIVDDDVDALEHGEIGVKRTWNKKPRKLDLILTEPAPGGPLSTELLRGYHGHVACHIWEKKAWIYEHFPMFRPALNSIFNVDRHPRAMKWDAQTPTPKLLTSVQAYRWRLDDMQAQEVIWMPYGVDVLGKYPISLYHGCIRYGSIIEPYMPDRVLRQFGYVQTRPMTSIKPNKEYKPENSYSVEYGEGMMSFWDDPSSHCLSVARLGDLALNPWDSSSDYMQWFLQRSHPKVQNPDNAPEGYKPTQHYLSAEARLHLIAHYLRPIYPEVRSQLSLEEQHQHIYNVIAVVQEFENLNISRQAEEEDSIRRGRF
ncbi:Serine/threonine-protein phosphatase 7 long form-like protein [Bienertia sinuspersici]